MNFSQFLKADYLFGTTGKFTFWYLYLFLFLAMTVCGFAVRMILSKKENYSAKEYFAKQFFWSYLFFGLLGLASVFARAQNLPTFGSRIFTFIIIKLFVIANIWLYIYYRKWTKKEVLNLQNKKRKEKWLKKK